MSLSREAMLDVMAYVDGELSGDALDRTESLLASDEDAARLALELRTLGDCVRVIQTDRARSKNPDEIADDVMNALDKKVAVVVPIAIRRRNAMIVGSFSTAFAIAAAWFLLAHNNGTPLPGAPETQPVAQASAQPTIPVPVIPTQTAVDPEKMAAEAYMQSGVDIESVDSPKHEVSVFYVPGTASANPNASSVVVWIGEDEQK
jgi:hypothetical protein